MKVALPRLLAVLAISVLLPTSLADGKNSVATPSTQTPTPASSPPSPTPSPVPKSSDKTLKAASFDQPTPMIICDNSKQNLASCTFGCECLCNQCVSGQCCGSASNSQAGGAFATQPVLAATPSPVYLPTTTALPLLSACQLPPSFLTQPSQASQHHSAGLTCWTETFAWLTVSVCQAAASATCALPVQ